MGDDGHIHLIESTDAAPHRLTWADSDFETLPGLPPLPGVTGDLEDSHVFAHPTPSPTGRQVAVFGLLPVDEDDIVDPRQLRAAHEPTEDDSVIGLPWGIPRAFVAEEEEPEVPDLPAVEENAPLELEGDEEGDEVGSPILPEQGESATEADEDDDEVEIDRRYWPGATVYVLDRGGISVSEVASIEDGHPHHLSWTPDGRKLLLLHQGEERLRLDIIDPDKPGQGLRVAEGMPIFWSFEPNGQRIAVRVGSADGSSRILIARLRGNRPGRRINDVGYYHAPQWFPDGKTLLAVLATEKGPALYSMTTVGSRVRKYRTHQGRMAFRISPDGLRVASAIAPEGAGPLRALEVTPTTGGRAKKVFDEPLVAFDWLDDERIALCLLADGATSLRFAVLTVGEKAVEPGPAFVPTPESRVSLHFFEQVQGSHPFLDRKSGCVVVAGVRPGRDDAPSILLFDLQSGSVRALAAGRYACFFSPPAPGESA